MRIPKHKPPSRIRYEKAHPTVSLRLDKELKTRLREKLKKESFADFVKEWLGEREREEKSLKEAYDDGYERAKKKFGIYTKCSICGEPMVVSDLVETKKELTDYLRSHVYHHIKCKEAQDRRRREISQLFKK